MLQAPTIFVALRWALSRSSPSFLSWGAQNRAQSSRCGLTRAEWRRRITSLTPLAALFATHPRIPLPLLANDAPCSEAALGATRWAQRGSPRSFTARAAPRRAPPLPGTRCGHRGAPAAPPHPRTRFLTARPSGRALPVAMAVATAVGDPSRRLGPGSEAAGGTAAGRQRPLAVAMRGRRAPVPSPPLLSHRRGVGAPWRRRRRRRRGSGAGRPAARPQAPPGRAASLSPSLPPLRAAARWRRAAGRPSSGATWC